MALGLLHQNVLGKLKHLPSQLQIGRLLFIFFLSGCNVFFLCSVTLDRIIFSIFSICGLFFLLPVLLVFLLFTVLAISVFAVFLRVFFSIGDSGGIKFLAASGLGRLGIFAAGNLDFHLFIFDFRAGTFAVRRTLDFFFGASGGCLWTSLSVGLLVGLGASLSIGLLVGLRASLSVGLLVGLRASLSVGLPVGLGASLSVGLLVGLGTSFAIGHLLVRLGTSLTILGAGHLLVFGCRARFAVGL